MEIQKYVDQKKKLYDDLLLFIEDSECNDDYFNKLAENIKNCEIKTNRDELENFIQLVINISNNHYRQTGFFDRIKQLLQFLKDEIQTNFSNREIFELFESNKILLLYLIENKIIIYDEFINKMIENSIERNGIRYFHFFLQEIVEFHKTAQNSKEEEKYQNKLALIDKYSEKRHQGENDSYLCSLIREDSVEEFIKYVNKTNFPLNSRIQRSIFETNSLLIDNDPTLIEYSAFFGSIQIFRYLKMNKVDLEKSFWFYAIHSNNAELIHILEDEKVETPNNSYIECFTEAIKCHHNDIAIYINDTFLYSNENNKKLIKKKNEVVLRYSNYYFFPENFKDKDFFNLCQYKYTKIVNFLLEIKKDYIETKIISAAEENEVEIVYFLLLKKNRINENFFKGNGQIRTLIIPPSIKSIDNFAFDGCYSLKKIFIPSSVTKIGNCAFRECSNLKKISIPPSVTSIEEFTFDGCSSLKEILIPNSVISIGEYAFDRCYSLKEIEIPYSVKYIGLKTFSNCEFDSIKVPYLLAFKIFSVKCKNFVRI